MIRKKLNKPKASKHNILLDKNVCHWWFQYLLQILGKRTFSLDVPVSPTRHSLCIDSIFNEKFSKSCQPVKYNEDGPIMSLWMTKRNSPLLAPVNLNKECAQYLVCQSLLVCELFGSNKWTKQKVSTVLLTSLGTSPCV